MDAEEVFTLDELEDFAAKRRKRVVEPIPVRCALCNVVGKEIAYRAPVGALGGEPVCVDCVPKLGF